ncbi:hypothetical protein STEG23_022259 [Scotinomys teguina]
MNEDKAKELLHPDNKEEMNDYDCDIQDKQQKIPNLEICAVKEGTKMRTKGTGNLQYNVSRVFSKAKERNGIET